MKFIKVLQVGPFQSNCIIVGDQETKEAVVFDPGDEAGAIIKELEANEFKPSYILLTHAHIDHVLATTALLKKYSAEVCLHRADLELYEGLKMQAQMFGLSVEDQVAEVTRFLKEGDVISNVLGLELKILHTPGHSPGCVCFYFENFPYVDDTGKEVVFPLLVCGDTLFMGSIGRTDLWGGNYEQLIASVQNKLFTLSPETIVLPGHGPQTSIEKEKSSNPFFR